MAETLRGLDLKEMGRRVKIRREEKGLSREALAGKLGVTAQFIADIENGNKGISIKRLFLMRQILDVSADYILAGEPISEEDASNVNIVREEIMAFLQKCDLNQLDGISKIAKIYADGVRMK